MSDSTLLGLFIGAVIGCPLGWFVGWWIVEHTGIGRGK